MAKKSIGSLLVEIGIDLTDFEKKMNQFQRQFGKVGTQVQDAGTQIGAAFGGVALAIGGGIGFAVKKAAEFEQALANVKAVTGSSAKEMEQLKKLALETGTQFGYGATESANGIGELIKAGVSMKDVINGGLKGALTLAAAGELEMGEAAAIASTALNSFQKDGLDVSQVADILAGAANASATDVREMQMGLSQAAAVASGAGMSFQDTATALAVFAQNGLKGSDAGTSLKTMLNTLQPSTKEQTKLFQELGLMTKDGSNAFYDANGNLKSLDQIAGLLQKSMSGLSAAQRQQAMKTLFGTDAMRASNILFKEGAQGVTKMKAAMGNVSAEDVARDKLNSFNGALKKLKASFDTFMIAIGDNLVPLLKGLASVVQKVTDYFNNLSPGAKKFIAIGAAVAFVITGMIAVVAFLTAGLGALAAAEWAVIAPIAGIIAAVVAVIAIFVALGFWLADLYKKNEAFRETVNAVWTAIKETIMAVVAAIIPVVTSIWQTFITNVMQAWSIIQPVLAAIWQTIVTVFGAIANFISRNMGIIKSVISFVFAFIGAYIKTYMQIAWTIIQLALNAIVTTFKIGWTIAKTVVLAVFNVIKTYIGIVMTVISGVIKTVLAVIKGDWSGAWTAIKETFFGIFNKIKDFLGNMGTIFLDAGKGLINALIDGIKGAASKLWDTVTDIADTIRDFLPFSPAKVGPLSDLDRLDFAGPISKAIKTGTPDVQASMNSMLTVPDINPNATFDAGAGTTLVLNLDGKTIAKKTFDYLGGNMRVRGAVT